MHNQSGKALVALLAGLVVGGLAGWYVGSTGMVAAPGTPPEASSAAAAAGGAAPAGTAVTARYGFEADSAIDWVCGDYERALACKGLVHSNELHQEGLSSLKVDVDLSGSSERRAAGEIWVDVNNFAPAGAQGPVSLANQTLTAWVYATPGSVGDRDKPNGFQLFVKDREWRAKYGPWFDVKEGQWMQLSFPVGAAAPDFDPSQVNAIGLKIATGEGSSAKFQGPVYVDAVSW